jgi:sugar lactone lactonase YvrE
MDTLKDPRMWIATLITVASLIHGAAAAEPYRTPRVEVLVPGSVIHAVEGIAFGTDGKLYGTSIHAQAVYRIDTTTGLVEVAVPSPMGESDDVAIGPAGTRAAGIMAWTAQSTGEIRIQRPGAKPVVIMRDVPRVNPIAFTPDGRLFTAQVGAGDDALWELDVIGTNAPRQVVKGQGSLNGFGFDRDGRLFAPLFRTDKLVAVDVTSGAYTVIAQGVGTSAAAKPDGKGNVISVDYINGDVWRTNIKTGASQKIAHLPDDVPDNLAIAPDGTIFIASVADSRILALDPATGKIRRVVDGRFTIALGAGMTTLDGRESLIVADPFGYRFVDPTSGAVTRPPWAANRGASSAVAANEKVIAFSYSQSSRVRVLDRKTDQIVAETTAVKAPRGVAITATGEVLVADAVGNRIVRMAGADVIDVATGLHHPVGLVMENEVTAIVSEVGTGTISRINLRNGQRTVIASGLSAPTGLARMKDGRVAVVEPGKGTVIAIELETGNRMTLASGLALSLAEFHLPQDTNAGIAVARDGTIFVACPGDNTVVKITL